MISGHRQSLRTFRPVAAALLALLTLVVIGLGATGSVDAKKKAGKSASATKKRPTVTRVDPREVEIGKTLTISGKNIVKGKNKMLVVFQRAGSKRKFTQRGTGVSSKSMTVKVPNVAADIPASVLDSLPASVFRIRLISKYGISKKWSAAGVSPLIRIGAKDVTSAGDCDLDGVANSVDADDDNDLLDDVTEAAAATDPCDIDTDGDIVSDYYEYRVAVEFNGGPVLPYPGRRPFANPLVGDSDIDYDGDKLKMIDEYNAWRYTGRMDRFYSDANQDSDLDGVFDDLEDEDADLLPNIVELLMFADPRPLEFLRTDTDGDGLCDGLDDEDRDGPPT
ncbi:MAG: hypothetical protein WBK99_02870, partial [Solirubrobacterales bacterium]